MLPVGPEAYPVGLVEAVLAASEVSADLIRHLEVCLNSTGILDLEAAGHLAVMAARMRFWTNNHRFDHLAEALVLRHYRTCEESNWVDLLPVSQ